MIHPNQTLIFQHTLRGWTVGFRAILNQRQVFEVCAGIELYRSFVKARALAQYSESEEIKAI